MPQINITVGKATIDKIDDLKQKYGSRSQAVAIAIDRFWRDELFASEDLEDAHRRLAEEKHDA